MSEKDPVLLVTTDFTDDFNRIVSKFKRDAVLVGIPQEGAGRESGEDAAPINNATLLAINEFGSPANNIPPRPVMSIGIRAAQTGIAELFRQTAIDVLTKGSAALKIYYERIGMLAATSVKLTINQQIGIEPPSAATMAARKAKGFKGDKALIVTGQMRNAITYVVEGDE